MCVGQKAGGVSGCPHFRRSSLRPSLSLSEDWSTDHFPNQSERQSARACVCDPPRIRSGNKAPTIDLL